MRHSERSSNTSQGNCIKYVAAVWFEHDAHEPIEGFVSQLILAYVEFDLHDRYAPTTKCEIEQLFARPSSNNCMD